MNLKTATPAEIDSQLAELYRTELKLRAAVESAVDSLHHMLGERSTGRTRKVWPTSTEQAVAAAEARRNEVPRMYSRTFGEQLDRIAAAEAALAANLDEQAPLDAEYESRPWSRFMVVAGGHIHSSRHCSTCNKGQYMTVFGWQPEMSGMDEAEALVALAEQAYHLCTVCFPNAPVLPEAAVASKHCAGSGRAPIAGTVRGGNSRYGDCTVCTDRPLIVGGGVTRKHKAKELRTPAAPAVETPAPVEPAAEAPVEAPAPAAEVEVEVDQAVAELPVDVDGRPIPVGVLVECVGEETGTLTGRHGRAAESGFYGDGTGRIVIAWGASRPTWSPTARTASRVRVIDPATMERATIGDTSGTVHAYDWKTAEAGCGYHEPARPRTVLLLDEATPITCTELGCRPHNVPAMIGSHGAHHFIPGDQAGGPTSGPCSLRWPTPCGRPYGDPLHVPFPNPLKASTPAPAPAGPAPELLAQVGAPRADDGRRPVMLIGREIGIVRPVAGGWCGWAEQGTHVPGCDDPATLADSAQHAAEAVVDEWLRIETRPGGRVHGITWSRVRWLPELDADQLVDAADRLAGQVAVDAGLLGQHLGDRAGEIGGRAGGMLAEVSTALGQVSETAAGVVAAYAAGDAGRLADLAGEPELIDAHGEVWYVDKEAISGDLYRTVEHEGPGWPLDKLDSLLGPLRVPPPAGGPSGT